MDNWTITPTSYSLSQNTIIPMRPIVPSSDSASHKLITGIVSWVQLTHYILNIPMIKMKVKL